MQPGAISPAATQANLASTFCRKGGYTFGIRPSTSVTGKELEPNAASYGFSGRMGDAEYGHLISLLLGEAARGERPAAQGPEKEIQEEREQIEGTPPLPAVPVGTAGGSVTAQSVAAEPDGRSSAADLAAALMGSGTEARTDN
ncbi:hypothetical protein OG352_00635 [Streptomyces sp. NBC_01485]|uniref:hypothetical protein n=1 Tax=Streptomyces sp. NBC_01485 TaxID=2903884 RepID=UPI002E2EC36E|nr:hypothetical protein [Streptomyces sp. NBC_01485]